MKNWLKYLAIFLYTYSASSQSVLDTKVYKYFDSVLSINKNQAKIIIKNIEDLVKKNNKDYTKGIYYYLKALYIGKSDFDFDAHQRLIDSSAYYFKKIKDPSYGVVQIQGCYYEADPNKIIARANLARADISKINDSLLLFELKICFFRAKMISGEYDSALHYFKKAEKYVVTDAQYLKSGIGNAGALIYSTLGLHNISLKYLEKELALVQKYSDTCKMNQIVTYISDIYIIIKDYENAEKFIKRFIYNSHCDQGLLENYNYSKALLFIKKGQFDSCQYYIDSILPFGFSFKNDIGKDMIDQLECRLKLDQKKYGEVLLLCDKRNFNAKQLGEAGNRIFPLSYSFKLTSFIKLKKYNEAILCADTLSSYLKNAKKKSGAWLEVYESYATAYKELKMYDKAIFYFGKRDSLNYQIEAKKNNILANESMMAMENKMLTKEKKFAQQTNFLIQLDNQQKTDRLFYRTLLLIIILILFTVIVFWFINYRKTSIKEKLLLKRERDLNIEEIKVLNKELNRRKQKSYEIVAENIFSDDSIITRLKETDDWIEFFLNAENTFGFKFSEFSELYPTLTTIDFKHICLILFNMSNKEVGEIMLITENGSKKARQRLKSKLGIQSGEKLQKELIQTLLVPQ